MEPTQTRHPFIFYVNGYGAAPVTDGNYGRYLGRVRQHVIDENGDVVIYLAGGLTNRKGLTEAQAMRQWFEANGIPSPTRFVLLEDTTTARDNLLALYDRVGDVVVFIYCEYTRRHQMLFLASRIFTRPVIVPIQFDARSMELRERLKQEVFKTLIEIGAWYVPAIDRYRRRLRDEHVARARAADEAKAR